MEIAYRFQFTAKLLLLFSSASLLFPLDMRADTSDLTYLILPSDNVPRVTTTIGPVEIGLRYRVSAESIEKVTTITTKDYKEVQTKSYDTDYSSTQEWVNKLTTNFDGNFKIGYSKNFDISFGEKGSIENLDTSTRKTIDHSKQSIQQDILSQTTEASNKEVIESTSFDFTGGYLKTELLISNFSEKTIALSNIQVAITSIQPLTGGEVTIASFTLGIDTTSIPGAALGEQALTLSVPPYAVAGKPFRQVVYLEKLPAYLIKQYLSEGRLFHVQINGITYSDGALGSTPFPLQDKVAQLQSDNIVANVIREGADRLEYVKPMLSSGDPLTLETLVQALDKNVNFSGDGADRFISQLDGKSTKFRSWQRQQSVGDFAQAQMTDGSWTATIISQREMLQPITMATVLKPGDRAIFAYLKKEDIFKAAYDEHIRAGVITRACNLDLGKISPAQVCFQNVRPNDVLRVEGRSWTESSEIVDLDTDHTADMFSSRPEIVAAGQKKFVHDALQFGKVTFSYPKGHTELTMPGEIKFSAKIGGTGSAISADELQSSGRMSFEHYPDGWFAFNFLMPPTFGTEPVPVCFQEQPDVRVLKFGRATNMSPASLNDADCSAGGCILPHAWVLKWKETNPYVDKKVYEARTYQLLTKQFASINSQEEYFSPQNAVSSKRIQQFRSKSATQQFDASAPIDENCVQFPLGAAPPY